MNFKQKTLIIVFYKLQLKVYILLKYKFICNVIQTYTNLNKSLQQYINLIY